MSPKPHSQTLPPLKSPAPRHKLTLNKPLADASPSDHLNALPTPHTPSSSGFRAHLGHLLPRRTYFRARVTIHQISSVPLVYGEFGVRWKFTGVHSATSHKYRLLDKVKARKDKGKGREKTFEEGALVDNEQLNERLKFGGDTSKNLESSGSIDSSAQSSSISSQSNNAALHSTHLDTSYSSPALLIPNTSPARGITPFIKLKDHSVTWSQSLVTVLKFDIERETANILPNILKLVVLQRVIPDDPHGVPQNPRLGAVYLNLAEYVNQGSVERRYLLKESKTNATLKITIEIDYLSGETHYIPPPLAKGILSGIAGYLEQGATKKRPEALDLYDTHDPQDDLEFGNLPRTSTRRVSPKSSRSESTPVQSEYSDDEDDVEEHNYEVGSGFGLAFDIKRLPDSHGTKMTSTLIDALFNPSRVTEKTLENPFTFYEPEATPRPHTATAIGLGLSGVVEKTQATIEGQKTSVETFSMYSRSSSSGSTRTGTTASSKSHSKQNSSNSHSTHHPPIPAIPRGVGTPEGRIVVDNSELRGVRGWWKRHAHSRPSTPTRKAGA